MKKFFCLILLVGLVGCSTQSLDTIHLYTRDASSGTRDALEGGVGLSKGELSLQASEVTSNGDMIQQVGKDTQAIGYVSMLRDYQQFGIKPLNYNNVVASYDNVLNQDYPLARNFIYMTRSEGNYSSIEKEQLIAAFIDYITLSYEGKLIIKNAGGIVDLEDSTPWNILKEKHPIVNQDNSQIIIKTGGSTSVEKLIKAAIESFKPIAGNFQYEPMHSGSSDGYKRTLGSEKDGPNQLDIGFASRDLKKEEDVSEAMNTGVFAQDAVVLVVHENNVLNNINENELQKVLKGSIESWEIVDE